MRRHFQKFTFLFSIGFGLIHFDETLADGAQNNCELRVKNLTSWVQSLGGHFFEDQRTASMRWLVFAQDMSDATLDRTYKDTLIVSNSGRLRDLPGVKPLPDALDSSPRFEIMGRFVGMATSPSKSVYLVLKVPKDTTTSENIYIEAVSIVDYKNRFTPRRSHSRIQSSQDLRFGK